MEFLEIPASYDEILVLTSIINKGYYRLIDIIHDTGYVKTRVLRIISKIRERWRLGIDIDYSRIGLRRLIVILGDMPRSIVEPDYLAVINKSIKGYVFLSYYVPASYDYRRLVEHYDPIEYYLFDKVFFPKPDLLRYYDKGYLKINLYMELENILSDTDIKVDLKALLDQYSVLKRFTVLDIKIIDALMRNAFISIKKLAKMLGEPSSKIASHVKMLKEYRVFNGFFIRKYPLEHLGSLTLGVAYIIRTNSLEEAVYIARKLQKIPFFGTTYLSVENKLLLTQLAVRERMLPMIPIISSILKKSVEVEKTYILSPTKMMRRIPEKRAFSKYERQWIFDIG